MPWSSEWSLPVRFSDQNFVCISHPTHTCYMSRYLIILDLNSIQTLSMLSYFLICVFLLLCFPSNQ